LYEITGNAASHLQFHITDSTHHFIKGSLYFYVKPNYDSILPAVNYIKEDIFRLIETLEWKNKPF
jgi:gliding motility-associated lipoprotein GldD